MRTAKVALFLAGSLLLVWTALVAFHGKIWSFSWSEQHRFTAMAMLTGTLRLHSGVSHVTGDEQVYNGAGYTNWGYGVPLLQLPFHAVARRLHSFASGFFPDRAIFFFYVAGLPPVLWLSLDRLLAGKDAGGRWLRRGACSLAAAGLVLTCALYPLIAYRFYVYEETIAYLAIAELYALCAYIHALRSTRLLPVCALAVAAGFGMLIRATGVVYLGVWLALLLLGPRPRARLLAFAGILAPFVAFWLYTNAVKSGSPLSFGYVNSVPDLPYHYPIQRFGSQCADTLEHAGQAVWELLGSFFVAAPRVPSAPHLLACHFTFEMQKPEYSPHGTDALFGPAVPVLLIWLVADHVLRRGHHLALYVPYAALLALFVSYAMNAMGFVWRYAFDFWPLIVLAVVLSVARWEPSRRRRVFGWPLALAFAVLGAVGFQRHVLPEWSSVWIMPTWSVEAREMPERFREARWGQERAFLSRVRSYDSFPHTWGGARGWMSNGVVDTFTNLYLGVPRAKAGARYELRLHTEGFDMPSLRVFVNGRVYEAHLSRGGDGDIYETPVDIDYAALTTPTVLTTIEWTRGFEPIRGGKLHVIELL